MLEGMNKTLAILTSLSIIANIILAVFIINKVIPDPASETSNYPYISPRIFMQNRNDILINFIDLRMKLKNYVEDNNLPLGFYFEYLPSGNSIGVNEKEEFVLASLLK